MTKKLFSKINYKTILLPQFYLLNRKIIRNPYIFIPICVLFELEGQGASPDYVPQAPPLPYDLSGPLAAWTKIVELGCFDVALRLDKSTSREQKI